MPQFKELKVRRSLLELQTDYENGNKKALEDLMRAWKGIKELPPTDTNSFFMLGGFHGEPFRGAGWGIGENYFWGGYCNHGNVLFPTWHRVYLLKLEEALQSIKGCKDVMLPYWDETDEYSLKNGIPWVLTSKDFALDGIVIPNPLRSYVFPVTITDNVSTDKGLYTKHKGYETVRYPLAGLVGTPEAQASTNEHNSKFPDYDENVKILNRNIIAWLDNTVIIDGNRRKQGVLEEFKRCLKAPNFTVFSNTTSSQAWNDAHEGEAQAFSIESPHNHIHLAVGGFEVPGQGNFSPIKDANGDMGENDTAALDPIFYFHHCNVDRVFWLWQKKNGFVDYLDVIEYYPGTNSSDNQGSTPGIAPNTWLSLESPLNPFKKIVDGRESAYTSLDCINIEDQLGLTYSKGSLEEMTKEFAEVEENDHKLLRVSRINKATMKGSFIIAAFVNVDGKDICLGYKSVLSRWSVTNCANCQTHLEVKAFFDLNIDKNESGRLLMSSLPEKTFRVEIFGHQHQEQNQKALLRFNEDKPYHLEIR
ncbi:MAG: tyrosinase family protein [Ferruginibacter sp.]